MGKQPRLLNKRLRLLEQRIEALEIKLLGSPAKPEQLKTGVVENLTQTKPSQKNTIKLWFDGGMKHGVEGYGSFQLSFNGVELPPVRVELLAALSANQAELMSLNSALRCALADGPRPEDSEMIIIGDSRLALFCSIGKWKAKHPNVKPIALANREIIMKYAKYSVNWVPRDFMVERFGH